jgi:hypothetical protein
MRRMAITTTPLSPSPPVRSFARLEYSYWSTDTVDVDFLAQIRREAVDQLEPPWEA